MNQKDLNTIFSTETLNMLFPPERADAFFDAIYGDIEEGAYDIRLECRGEKKNDCLEFAFVLDQRPGKCIVCNLTYGLPEVFVRHPVIALKELVRSIAEKLGKDPASIAWKLGATRDISRTCHEIPLLMTI